MERLLGWERDFVERKGWQEVSRVRSGVEFLRGFEDGLGGELSWGCETWVFEGMSEISPFLIRQGVRKSGKRRGEHGATKRMRKKS